MSGHHHNSNAATQNQGNSLGDRACVRQSKLYRMYESGNDVKAILGSSHLCWNPNETQGAYKGKKAYDHMADPNTKPEWTGRKENYENGNYYSRGSEPDYGRQQGQAPYARDDDNSNSLAKFARKTNTKPVYEPEPYETEYGGQQRRAGPGRDYAPDNRRREEEYEAPAYGVGSGHGRRKSFENGGGDSSYPLNKMKGNDVQTYRDTQANQYQQSSSFQTTRARSSEKAADRAAKNYFQQPVASSNQDRSTRPW